MRKISIVFALLVVFVFSSFAFAFPSFTYSSGEKSASGVISSTPCLLTDIAVYTNGSVDAVVTLYDNAKTNSGTVLYKVTVIGLTNNGGAFIPVPVKANNGIYMTLSGAGAKAIIFTTPQ